MAPVQDSPNAQQIEYWNATAGATVTLIHEWAAAKLRRAVANSADLRSVANQNDPRFDFVDHVLTIHVVHPLGWLSPSAETSSVKTLKPIGRDQKR
jgi:hypothetical protein